MENRVNEVRRLVLPKCWKHCPGKENPADLPSRGMTPAELAGSKLWRYGPDWLIRNHPCEEALEMPNECLKEMKTSCHPTHNLVVTGNVHVLSNIIGCENFSSLQRLLRVTAYVLRFIHMLKQLIKKLNLTATLELTASELARAENLWAIESQRCFKEDRNFPTWQRQLGLFLEDGVWRCKGRLGNADIPYTAKYPILLHKGHHLAILIIRDAHQ